MGAGVVWVGWVRVGWVPGEVAGSAPAAVVALGAVVEAGVEEVVGSPVRPGTVTVSATTRVLVWPGCALAATTAKPPVSARPPATVHLVT